jgi:hypothetical protein
MPDCKLIIEGGTQGVEGSLCSHRKNWKLLVIKSLIRFVADSTSEIIYGGFACQE